MSRELRDITDPPVLPQTVRRHLRQAGLKAEVKRKRPLLTARHRKGRLDHAIAHQGWSVDAWKRGHLVR